MYVSKISGLYEVYLPFLSTFKKYASRMDALKARRYDDYINRIYSKQKRTIKETEKIETYMSKNNIFYNL